MAEQEIRPAVEVTDEKSELSADDIRKWRELWVFVNADHYACFYEEAVADYLVSRWRLLDTLSKFLTAFSASGSTVAAWAVWSSSDSGKAAWAVASGLTAIIALVHMSLGISDRIKEDTLIFSTFQQLRLDLEIMKKKMRLGNKGLTDYLNDYMDITSKFGKAYSLKRPDFFLTRKREEKIQADINKRLGME
jgi:hypothetical protein